MVLHLSLSDRKSTQVSRTLLSTQADLYNAVVWTVSTLPLISKSLYQSFSGCTKCTYYNWYHRQFHIPEIFQFPSKIQIFILLLASFQFFSVVSWDGKVYNPASSLFLLIITRSVHLAEIRWSVCILKSQRSLCVSFVRTDSELCIYHFFG